MHGGIADSRHPRPRLDYGIRKNSAMNARQKLNAAYVQGALILAAVVGVLAQSWIAFGFTLAV